ncbi:MAG TPA: VOC family protein [Streptosporangiaceae bacterium]|nr:VOC family protein [Streptosporangiaceae bacterium]
MTNLLSCRPNLEVRDVDATVGYCVKNLGFEVEMSVGEPAYLALVRSGEVGLGIVLAENPGVNSTTACYIGVTDVDGLHARCRDLGVPVTTPLTDRPWGLRDFVIEIPGGHRLAFGERIA